MCWRLMLLLFLMIETLILFQYWFSNVTNVNIDLNHLEISPHTSYNIFIRVRHRNVKSILMQLMREKMIKNYKDLNIHMILNVIWVNTRVNQKWFFYLSPSLCNFRGAISHPKLGCLSSNVLEEPIWGRPSMCVFVGTQGAVCGMKSSSWRWNTRNKKREALKEKLSWLVFYMK